MEMASKAKAITSQTTRKAEVSTKMGIIKAPRKTTKTRMKKAKKYSKKVD